MELNGKAVQMSDMKRAEIVVEGIVEERIVNGKVARRLAVARGRRRMTGGSSLGSFPRGLGMRWEQGIGVGRVDVGSKI